MKQATLIFLVMLLCGTMFSAQGPVVKRHKNESFDVGEELTYKVTFGFFTVGRSITRVDKKFYKINSRTCYKIDAYGETSDWISWVTKVKDIWGAYIDTATVSTQVSYRKIREGRYKRDEITNFYHLEKRAEVKVLDYKTGLYATSKTFSIPENATDLVGGFIHLRFIDFSHLKKGDTISIAGFLEDTGYNLKIVYKGKENINTRLGKIPCHVLIPQMPDNKLFDGENAITVWISDDRNKIPIKIQAKMFIGNTGIELISFRNLKNQIRILY